MSPTKSRKRPQSAHSPAKRGGKFFPALCRFFGTLILVAVILAALPLTVPRFFGYEIFSVVSESMEPALPVNSLVYVRPAEPEEILPGEIVAFRRDGAVVTHRAVENRREENCLITKGDANAMEDIQPVPYPNLIGTVSYHVPGLGMLMLYFASTEGKLRLGLIALSGAILNGIGTSLRHREKKEKGKHE